MQKSRSKSSMNVLATQTYTKVHLQDESLKVILLDMNVNLMVCWFASD